MTRCAAFAGCRDFCSGGEMVSRPPIGQMDLLDWSPPQPVARFDEHRVRASNFRDRLARAISVALKDADDRGHYREQIAQQMSEFLGERVSKHMLDAYASQARGDHTISVARLLALLHATRDARLLQLLAEPLGWAVVERKYLPLIELAAVREQSDTLAKRAKEVRRAARREGAL